MKIIIGLGNPGLRYRNTRHNAGFMVIKALSKKYRISLRKAGFHGVYGVGRIGGEEVMLFEPRTYMNLSGEAVGAVCAAKADGKGSFLVIVDDVNLPLGGLRFRESGSSGGHNGLKSIISRMGMDFPRLRLGIDPGVKHEGDLSDLVLAPFSRQEREGLAEMIKKAVSCVEEWIDKGAASAMEIYNR
ncbi:MAG: aminoacyl-tRNA hydrolase [Candidatus Omnitrophica bacterium]|jgi:PTH1 family peptidyl-tRNA hydrolase|nr:aminoacyl-tRNA hydrolase [Candidatus Omnitrophota bacterium]